MIMACPITMETDCYDLCDNEDIETQWFIHTKPAVRHVLEEDTIDVLSVPPLCDQTKRRWVTSDQAYCQRYQNDHGRQSIRNIRMSSFRNYHTLLFHNLIVLLVCLILIMDTTSANTQREDQGMTVVRINYLFISFF